MMFYTRFDRNTTANPPMRGFTFAYPAVEAAQLNRVAIAVANSFDPFPEAAQAPAASAGASPASALKPLVNSSPAAPQPAATALVIAPGKALTALEARDCPNPTVAGKPVRIERADAATGLALIAGDFSSKGAAPRFGEPAQDLVVLGFARIAPLGKLGLVCGRRVAARHHRGGGQERRRRTGVRSKGRAGRPRGADRRRPQARGRRRARRAAPHDCARSGSRLPRRRRTRDRERRPAQRRRHRRARERRARRRLLPEMSAADDSP